MRNTTSKKRDMASKKRDMNNSFLHKKSFNGGPNLEYNKKEN